MALVSSRGRLKHEIPFAEWMSQDKREEAIQIARHSENKASLFYLGRQLENIEAIKQAIEFYELAGRVDHAVCLFLNCSDDGNWVDQVRLALRHGLDGDLLSLGPRASKDDLQEMALYFYKKKQWQHAAQLFAKVYTSTRLYGRIAIVFLGRTFFRSCGCLRQRPLRFGV